MGKSEAKSVRIWPVVVFGATVSILACLIVKMFLVAEPPASLLIAIAVIAGLLILSPRVFDLAELTISKGGLVAKIRDMEQKVETAERKIDQLFAYTMSDSMFENLQKLASGRFGHFRNNGGLRRELRHLRDVGYISVQGHIGDLPDDGQNLSDFVTVTPVGRDFVALRQSLEAKAPAPSPD
jgi:hypothetical protein